MAERGVEDAGVQCPAVAQDGGHADVFDVRRLVFQPLLHIGLEAVAVGAAIPEQLDDFDLAGVGGGLGGYDPVIVHAFPKSGPGGGRKLDQEHQDRQQVE